MNKKEGTDVPRMFVQGKFVKKNNEVLPDSVKPSADCMLPEEVTI